MKRLILIAGLAFFIPATLQAQDLRTRVPPPKSAKIPQTKAMSDEQRARVTTAEYAACVLSRNERKVRAFLDAPLASATARAGQKVAFNSCLYSGELSMDPWVFRGALFERLYKSSSSAKLPTNLEGVPDYPFERGVNLSIEGADVDVALLTFAQCVVRASPSHAIALLNTPLSTPAEDAVFANLTPHLSPCLPQGGKITFSRPVLRGMIAEATYRLASMAAAGS